MKHSFLKPAAVAMSLALVAACSPSPDETAAPDAAQATSPPEAAPSPSDTAPLTAANTLRLEGLGDLTIGAPVPEDSSFTEHGAQISGECHTVSSPDYPGVYAMTNDGEVRRISVSGDSPVMLVEGVGVGATEPQVRKAFPSFRATPHKYVAAPGKYLTQPGDDPRLRFEIGFDSTVQVIHVGVMPQLAYVEGCA